MEHFFTDETKEWGGLSGVDGNYSKGAGGIEPSLAKCRDRSSLSEGYGDV
jgi:hypothetical protein